MLPEHWSGPAVAPIGRARPTQWVNEHLPLLAEREVRAPELLARDVLAHTEALAAFATAEGRPARPPG